MICYNCKKQIPDTASTCPYCGSEIIHEEQLPKEIVLRRYQRWFFYGFIVLLVLGMIGVIVKIYSTNTDLVNKITEANDALNQKILELDTTKTDLAQKETLLQDSQANLISKNEKLSEIETALAEKVAELDEKTETFKKVLDDKVEYEDKYQGCELDLTSSESNVYNLIIKLGVGITNEDFYRIALADANLEGVDADEDGLSDEVEEALGTDFGKADTDGDGYSDKDEILSGFNPVGIGTIQIDQGYANQMKGKIILQVEQNGEAWYVNPGDGKKYFLGRPADAFKVMRNIEYWNKQGGSS